MKALPIILFACLCSSVIFSQSNVKMEPTSKFSLDFGKVQSVEQNNEEEGTFVKPYLNSCSTEADKLNCSIVHFINFIKSNVTYPSIAQENGFESEISIRFTISKLGQVENLRLNGDYVNYFKKEIHSAFQQFDNSQLVWNPGQISDEAIEVPVSFMIDFNL